MIEELAEQREPGIERRRQTTVGRHVGDRDVVAIHGEAEGGKRCIANDAGRFKIGHRDIVRGRRYRQRIECRLLGGSRGRCQIAITKGVCCGFCVVHDNARLVFRIGSRLERSVNSLHQTDIGEVRGNHAADLQAFDDGRGVAQRLVDDQVRDRAEAGVENHRAGTIGWIVVRWYRWTGRAKARRDIVCGPEYRIQQFGELQIRGTPMFLSGQ